MDEKQIVFISSWHDTKLQVGVVELDTELPGTTSHSIFRFTVGDTQSHEIVASGIASILKSAGLTVAR